MKKETSRKLSLGKIKIANLTKTIGKERQAPTTTVYFSFVIACPA